MRIFHLAVAAFISAFIVTLAVLAEERSSPERTLIPPTPPAQPLALPSETLAIQGFSEHNDTASEFARGMVPHHRQAIELAHLVPSRAASPQVKELAARFKDVRAPELALMESMFKARGELQPPPREDSADTDHHDEPGTPPERHVQRLQRLSGAAFDMTFLQMMINHHKGAIEMAQTEVAQGQNPEAKALAQKIIEDQRAEITTMDNLLKSM